MMRLVILIFLMAFALPLRAEEIVSGLSRTRVSIDASFDGTSILIYGAAMREQKPPVWPLLQVIITVEGPVQPVVVRQKARVAGIWVNRDWVAFDNAPSFYAVMTTGALNEILSEAEDARLGVSIPKVIGAARPGARSGSAAEYLAALQRIRRSTGSYLLGTSAVLLLQQSLFRTEVTLPVNLIEGDYKVRILLTRGREVVDIQESQITVSKAGLERLLSRMAQDQPLLYGLIALLLAAVAGGGRVRTVSQAAAVKQIRGKWQPVFLPDLRRLKELDRLSRFCHRLRRSGASLHRAWLGRKLGLPTG